MKIKSNKILNLAIQDESDPDESTKFVVSFEIRDDIQQPEQALRDAVQEFINSGTDEAKQAISNTNGLFNWGDAMTAVPDSLFIKHGLTKINAESISVFVNLNELLNDYSAYRGEKRKEIMLIAKIKKLINDHIIDGYESIKYWKKGENMFADETAEIISDRNDKLKQLIVMDIIDADLINKLIKSETDNELILIYEEILEYLETCEETEDE